MDRSIEQAFFERSMVLSDHPVSFDTDDSEPLDLEGREQRRAHFARVVSVIVGTLGVGALLALLRSAPPPAEDALIIVAAARPNPADVARIPEEQPTLTLPMELTAEEPAPATSSDASPASASSTARAVKAPALPIRAPRTRVLASKPLSAPPLVPVQSGNPLPPTARFAD